MENLLKFFIVSVATIFATFISVLHGWLQFSFFGPYPKDSIQETSWLYSMCAVFILSLYWFSRLGHIYFINNEEELAQITTFQKKYGYSLQALSFIFVVIGWFIQ